MWMPEIDHILGSVEAGVVEAYAHRGHRGSAPPSGSTGTVEGTAPPRGRSEPGSGAGPAFQAGAQDIQRPRRTWPLRSYLELDALPGAVPCARLRSRHVLWEWGLARFGEPAEVVVSELATNAVQATADRVVPLPIRLWLSSDHSRVRIAVWDADPRSPRPKPISVDGVPEWSDDGGRGLFLVASLSQQWGWYATQAWGGKVVWAEVAE